MAKLIRRRICLAASVQFSASRRVARTRSRQCRDGRLAGGRRAVLLVEQHRTEPDGLVHHQLVALLVPGEDLPTFDVVAECVDQLRRFDAGADAHAGTAAVAVEVGGNDEALVGQRVVGRNPRATAGAHLELTGLPPASCDAVGEGQRERSSGALGVDGVEIDMHVAATADVDRAIAAHGRGHAGRLGHGGRDRTRGGRGAPDRRATRRLDRAARRARRGWRRSRSPTPCRPSAAAITMRANRGCSGRREHRSARGGRPALGVERAETHQQFMRLLQCSGRRRIDEVQLVHRGSPHCKLERHAGQVDLSDLGFEVCAAGGVFQLAPQPVGDAGLCSSGTAGALVGRGARLVLTVVRRVMPLPRSWLGTRARPASTTMRTPLTVSDDSAMSVLKHHTPSPGRGRLQRQILLGQRERAGKQAHVDVVSDAVDQELLDPADLADAGEEDQYVARLVVERSHHRLAGRLIDPGSLRHGQPAHVDFEVSGRRSRSSAAPPSTLRSLATSGVADIARIRRSGRTVAAASSANARPRSVGTLRS